MLCIYAGILLENSLNNNYIGDDYSDGHNLSSLEAYSTASYGQVTYFRVTSTNKAGYSETDLKSDFGLRKIFTMRVYGSLPVKSPFTGRLFIFYRAYVTLMEGTMRKFVYCIFSALLTLSLCGCTRTADSIGGDVESGSSFAEVSDPFAKESSSEDDSSSAVSQVGDGYDYLREMDSELFTEDYIEYMKRSNSGISWENWQYKANGKICSGNTTITYSGGEVEIGFSMTSYTEAREFSAGYMVFIGGTPQVISLNGGEPAMMAEVKGENEQTTECVITFTPRLTKENIESKDDLLLNLVYIKNPTFLTSGNVEKNIDYEHSLSVATQRNFVLDGDCELIELEGGKAFEHFPETNIAVSKFMHNTLTDLEKKDVVVFTLHSSENINKPVIKDGKADVSVVLYGGKQKNAVYKVYFYVNHERVKVDGCDYITAELKEGFVAKYSTTLEGLKDRDFVYAIALSDTKDTLSRNDWVMKTDTRRLFTAQ